MAKRSSCKCRRDEDGRCQHCIELTRVWALGFCLSLVEHMMKVDDIQGKYTSEVCAECRRRYTDFGVSLMLKEMLSRPFGNHYKHIIDSYKTLMKDAGIKATPLCDKVVAERGGGRRQPKKAT